MASRVKVVSASLVGQEVSAQLSIQGSRVAGIHAYNT